MSHPFFKTIAIVGRPNVGKSRLFNRLAGKKVSIVHDQPGVTRDVISTEVDDHFILMDTGGIGMTNLTTDPTIIENAIHEQVCFAIQAADLVLFVTDGNEGCTIVDKTIANELRTYNKKTILVVNKVDHPKHFGAVHDFHSLGFGEPIGVSAEHGGGIDSLLNAIESEIGPKPSLPEETSTPASRIRICFAGRPNVGKSSLGNALLKTDRLIVSDVPGTTRDAVAIDLEYPTLSGQTLLFRLMDTAGLKPRSKVRTTVEYFASMRTQDAIQHSNIIFLVIDAREGVTQVDKKLAGQITESGKGLIVIVNKWDLAQKLFEEEGIDGYENIDAFKIGFAEAIRNELFSLPESPILFTSALENFAIDSILKQAAALYKRLEISLSTSQLNRAISKLMAAKTPSSASGKRLKVYYSVQTRNHPITLRLYCNQAIKFDPPYKRYLEAGLNSAFHLQGCPIHFNIIGKPKRPARPTPSPSRSHSTGKRTTTSKNTKPQKQKTTRPRKRK